MFPCLCDEGGNYSWFRPILSELIVAARESAEVNRKRAPSGPVKVVVTNQPHSRRHTAVDLVSGTTALLAWFPASWASKIAPCFLEEAGGNTQAPQEVSFSCPHRAFKGLQRDVADQVLQAVKFTNKNATGPIRVNLEVIELASRVLFQRPAYYVPEQTLQQHVRERVFPDRKLRKRVPDLDIAAFDAACNDVRRLAATSEAEKPVSFAIGNSWNDTLRADKRHHLEYTQRSQT